MFGKEENDKAAWTGQPVRGSALWREKPRATLTVVHLQIHQLSQADKMGGNVLVGLGIQQLAIHGACTGAAAIALSSCSGRRGSAQMGRRPRTKVGQAPGRARLNFTVGVADDNVAKRSMKIADVAVEGLDKNVAASLDAALYA